MRFFGHVAAVCTLLLSLPAVAGKLTTVATLPAHNDGAQPSTALTEFGGLVYGVTPQGGTESVGVLFQLDPNSGQETVLHTFGGDTDGSSPSSPLTVVNGRLYGTTSQGGAGNQGTLFSFDPATGTEAVVDSLANPDGQLVVLGNLLYGTAAGGVYSFDPTTGAVVTVCSLGGSEGFGTTGGLIAYDGALYGLTGEGAAHSAGAIYRVDPATAKATALYAFETGQSPGGWDIGLAESGGVLYGTTPSGGAHGYGSVYAFDLQSTKFSTLYSFGSEGQDPEAGLFASGGVLYGTTASGQGDYIAGTIFTINTANGSEKVLHTFSDTGSEGDNPQAPLVEVGGALLGTTALGGLAVAGGDGVAFSVDPKSARTTTLHNFTGSESSGNSALISYQGALYGTSTGNGAAGLGSILKVDPKTGAQQTVYSFAGGSDGADPAAALVAQGGMFYGTTITGGSSNQGTLFGFNPLTGAESVLVNFGAGLPGVGPSSLTSVSGLFYGTTSSVYGPGSGTLFSFDPASSTSTLLHTFTGTDGAPNQDLMNVNGTLYGTSFNGGPNGSGTVFSYSLASGTFSDVYSFLGKGNGSYPTTGLAYVDGALFGLASGFKKDPSTIFRIDPATGAETVVYTFPKRIFAPPTMTAVGNILYGSSPYGPPLDGYLFRFDPATRQFTTTYKFKGGVDGSRPNSSLLSVGSLLYGTTPSITTANGGTVFRIHQ